MSKELYRLSLSSNLDYELQVLTKEKNLPPDEILRRAIVFYSYLTKELKAMGGGKVGLLNNNGELVKRMDVP